MEERNLTQDPAQAVFDPAALMHACIVTGAEGPARDAFTERLAAAMVCRSSGPVPCGSCPDCRKALRGIHPDVIRISKPEDRSALPVERIRDLCADAIVLPNEAQRKVYILQQADRMNAAAQNALLKTLEEPPSHCCFILPVADVTALLPTVISRCARFRVPEADLLFGEETEQDAGRFLDALTKAPIQAAAFLSGLDTKKEGREEFFQFLNAVASQAARRAAEGSLPLPLWERLDRALQRAETYRAFNLNAGYAVGMLTACLVAPADNK